MSGREWQPGDVAIGYDTDWEIRVVRHRGAPDYWSAANGVWPLGVSADLLDYRPLVVIDPEDREQMRRIAECAADGDAAEWRVDMWQQYFREFANPTPPKPATSDAHDGCHDKGWTTVDEIRYCNNCGFSEGSRFIKGGGAA